MMLLWLACQLAVDDPEVLFAPTKNERRLEKRIVKEIRAARRTALLAIYQFTSKEIADALASAKRKGVDVRVLVDGVQSAQGGLYGEVLKILESARVPVRKVYPKGVASKGFREPEGTRPKFHHKFCVLDGERTITGSYNWTVLADEENYENLVILPGAKVGAKYAEEFERIWKDGTIAEE